MTVSLTCLVSVYPNDPQFVSVEGYPPGLTPYVRRRVRTIVRTEIRPSLPGVKDVPGGGRFQIGQVFDTRPKNFTENSMGPRRGDLCLKQAKG